MHTAINAFKIGAANCYSSILAGVKYRKFLWNSPEYHITKGADIVVLKNAFVEGEKRDIYLKGEGEIDCSGLYAYPCFVDTHMHILALGTKLLTHDLEKEDLKELLQKEKELLFARGWTQMPSLELINSVSYPVVLIRHCGHLAVINDAAKEKLGFKDNVIKEEDITKLYTFFDKQFYKRALKVAERELFKLGVTYVHSDDLAGKTYEDLVDILKDAKVRIYEKLAVKSLGEPRPEMFGQLTDRVYIGALKLYLDGSLGARTAYMEKPYLDTGERGELLHTKEELIKYLEFGKKHGVEVCIHVIGDGAFNFLAPILKDYPGNRIIHAQFASEENLKLLKHTSFSVQPHFYYEDQELFKYIQTDAMFYPFKYMHEHGYKVWFSSDAPVSPHDPRYVIESALKMGVTKEEALKLYTVGSKDWCLYEKDDPLENLPVLIAMDGGEVIETANL